MLVHAETGGRTRIPPLCIVPCGSGNNLALHMGIQTLDDAVSAALGGRVQLMDVVQMTQPDDADAPRLENAVDTSPPPLRDATAGTGSGGAAGSGAVSTDAAPYDEASACVRRSASAASAFSERVVFSVNTVGFGLGVKANSLAVESLRLCGRAQYMPAAYIFLLYNFTWLCQIEVVDPPEGARPLSRGQVAEAERLWNAARTPSAAAETASPPLAALVADAERDPTPSPITAPLSTALSPYCMLAASHNAYFGTNMAFSPHARLDDGLLDVCAIPRLSRVELVLGIKEAENLGALTICPSNLMRGRCEYAQAREIVIRPPDVASQERWLAGHDVSLVDRGAAAGGRGDGATAAREAAEVAPGGSGSAIETARRARTRLNVHPQPMTGAPQNVDGEIKGFFPCRLRVVPRVLAMLVPPPAPASI